MDRITLPLIRGNVAPRTVFDEMAKAGVHAAVVAPGGRAPMIVTNQDVDDALERGLPRIGDVEGMPLHVARAEADDWAAVLDEANAGYGVVSVTGLNVVTRSTTVKIITRHEAFADAIRNAGKVCRCRNNHRAPGGSPCPFCRASVTCA
jgi:hypothetical protein